MAYRRRHRRTTNHPPTLPAGRKACFHQCEMGTLRCCACMDRREISQTGSYMEYVDGEGFKLCASREKRYCPMCIERLTLEVPVKDPFSSSSDPAPIASSSTSSSYSSPVPPSALPPLRPVVENRFNLLVDLKECQHVCELGTANCCECLDLRGDRQSKPKSFDHVRWYCSCCRYRVLNRTDDQPLSDHQDVNSASFPLPSSSSSPSPIVSTTSTKCSLTLTSIHSAYAQLTCAICLEIFGDDPVTIPCGHTFCKHCLLDAIRINNRCPLCRTIVRPPLVEKIAPSTVIKEMVSFLNIINLNN